MSKSQSQPPQLNYLAFAHVLTAMISDKKKIQHLYSRASFGLKPDDFESCTNKSVSENVEQLFADSKEFAGINIIEPLTEYNERKKNLSKEEKEVLKKELRDKHSLLNVTWLQKLATDKAQLRERIVFFWHNHFACRSIFPHTLQVLNNTIRVHALGNFKDLLLAVSQTPAMLLFLNNAQNKKAHPNENFARELMELFTIGRGHYSEDDVKEAARAFTGWSLDFGADEFLFRERLHDYGEKTFMGKTGNFSGEDIIHILLQQKQTAVFVVRKIYREFVCDVPDENRIAALADSYFKSDYNTGKLMQEIFTSDWFYDEKNIGSKIKSPIELIVNLNRTFNISYEKPEVLVFVQRALDQQLFFPPNVSGWPGGRTWIDSSSLMLRMKLASLVLNDGIIELDLKSDDDLQEGMMMSRVMATRNRVRQNVRATPDWNYFLKNIPEKITTQQLADRLLNSKLSSIAEKNIEALTSENIKTITLELLSLPEYQLG